MHSNNCKKQIFEKFISILSWFLLILLPISLPVNAGAQTTELIQYDYDNTRQVIKVTYDDGTEVDYTYDGAGNRVTKTLTFAPVPVNSPPNPFSYLSPPDASANHDRIVDISWLLSDDPDTGDVVLYDIYMDSTSPPSLYRSGYNSTNYTVTLALEPNTTYYWKILAKDNHNATTEGPAIWSFTTGADTDDDLISDTNDNCPSVFNTDQIDTDEDGVGDACDNCINDYNPNQEDISPPQSNGIGDACDCEGNFDCDSDVDGTDAHLFKLDFGRSELSDPCTPVFPCNGDFDCDSDVDGTDAHLFKLDFGRSAQNDPCPVCEVGEWCIY